MDPIFTLLSVIVLPLAIAGGFAFISDKTNKLSLFALGLGIAYLAGAVVFSGIPDLPPHQSIETWPYIYIVFTLALAAIGSCKKNLSISHYLSLFVAGFFAAALNLQNILWADGITPHAILAGVGIALGFTFLIWVWKHATAHFHPLVVSLIGSGTLGFSTVSILANGSFKIAFTCAAAFTGSLLGLYLVKRNKVSEVAASVLLVFALFGSYFHLISGYVFAEVPLASLILIVISPAMGFFAPKKFTGTKAIVVQAALVLIPMLVAVAYAAYTGMPKDTPY